MKQKLLPEHSHLPVDVITMIGKMVDDHMRGGAFQSQLQDAMKIASSDSSDDLQGGSYGLYVKKKSKVSERQGGALLRPQEKKKVGRPKTKMTRSFTANSKTARRAALVKRVMQERNLSMVDASHYVKQHGLQY